MHDCEHPHGLGGIGRVFSPKTEAIDRSSSSSRSTAHPRAPRRRNHAPGRGHCPWEMRRTRPRCGVEARSPLRVGRDRLRRVGGPYGAEFPPAASTNSIYGRMSVSDIRNCSHCRTENQTQNPRHAQKSRAKKSAMPKDVASVVICEACGEQVAEIMVDGKRALCSECHLMESGTRLRCEKKTSPED